MVAGVPSKALQLLNLPVKFNPREAPKPVWEPLTPHGTDMVKKRNWSCISCSETCALEWCCWKEVPRPNVTFWTFPGPCPLPESITWASNYTYLARSWEKRKLFKLMGESRKEVYKSILLFQRRLMHVMMAKFWGTGSRKVSPV